MIEDCLLTYFSIRKEGKFLLNLCQYSLSLFSLIVPHSDNYGIYFDLFLIKRI